METSSVAQARSRIRLDRGLLQQLSQRAPARLLLQTLAEWSCIIALAITANHAGQPAVTLFCMLLIATRQHALLVLMHEYAHHQFSRRRAWLNDMLGDALTALPFLITVHGFRRNHLPHHRHVRTDDDPNWVSAIRRPRYQFPKTKMQTYAEMVKHALGWYTLEELGRYTVGAGMAVGLPRATRRFRMVYGVLVLALTAYFDLWLTVLLYWFVPMATFLMGLLYVHDLGEHFGMPAPGINGSRTVLGNWLDRLFFCPHGVNFHAEHHLYPSVPFHRLRQLHEALQHDDDFRSRAVIAHGYLRGLVVQLTQFPQSPQSLQAPQAPQAPCRSSEIPRIN